MGWFFNNNSGRQNQNNNSQTNDSGSNENSFFSSRSSSSFYSKKRKCQNDPDDDKYLICRTVIKDNNGTKQEQERIPKNSSFRSNLQQKSQFSSSGIFSPLSNESQQQKVFDKFASFLAKPIFFGFHNSTQDENTLDRLNRSDVQNQSLFKSYGQSKTCHIDPQDSEYVICRSRVQDGSQTKQIQERLKMFDQLHIPSFKRQFSGFGNEIDKEIYNLMNEINSDFNLMIPFIGPMMGFVHALNPQNLERKLSDQTGFQPSFGSQRKQSQSGSQRYFTSGNRKKDTNLYDL